jgi:hypothetical protein
MMNALQLKVILERPDLYDCECHPIEDASFDTSSIITDTNNEIVKLSKNIRELSDVLRKKMGGD